MTPYLMVIRPIFFKDGKCKAYDCVLSQETISQGLVYEIMEMPTYHPDSFGPINPIGKTKEEILEMIAEFTKNGAIIPIGTRVKTTQENLDVTDWLPGALIFRKWGIEGSITKAHNGHGECYTVLHDDATSGCYDPSEFEILPPKEIEKLNSNIEEKGCAYGCFAFFLCSGIAAGIIMILLSISFGRYLGLYQKRLIHMGDRKKKARLSNLTFKKDGLYGNYFIPPRKENETGEHFQELISLENEIEIFSLLNDQCSIEEGTPFRSILEFVAANATLTTFLKYFCNCKEIGKYHKIAREQSIPCKYIKLLEICWIADEVICYDKSREQHLEYLIPNLLPHLDFTGFGPMGDLASERESPNQIIRFGVNGNIAKILDIPIQLMKDKLAYIKTTFPLEGDYKEEVVLSGTYHFTLLHILKAIYEELSHWCAGPDDGKTYSIEEINAMEDKIYNDND